MTAKKKTAHLAGLFYLVVTGLAPFVLLFVPGQIMVPGDAAATVANIAAKQELYVAGILAGIVNEICFVAAILLLYRILRDSSETLSVMMVAAILLQVPVAFVDLSHKAATLAFVRGGGFLDVFDGPERDALVMLLAQAGRHGVLVSQVFWGLWLLPLGALVIRSRLMPRLLGLWLILNGLAYMALSVIGLVWPDSYREMFDAAIPLMFGEAALVLWLLIFGVRERGSPLAPETQRQPQA